MAQLCAAVGCRVYVTSRSQLCGGHLRMLPRLLQERLRATERPVCGPPSEAHYRALQDAVETLRGRELRT